ncbi:MAG: polyprenyl synthetase family protein [Dehalococcoidia bacterium]|nr:polyprenyl synthetase family protein [Dehalococcoidia bacterium]
MCDSCGGEWRRAMPAAAAIELWLTAGDVFDEIEDQDEPGLWLNVGIAQATNAAIALLFLSQQAVFRLGSQGYSESAVLEIARTLGDYGLRSTFGQHRDLVNESLADVSEEDYIEMTGQRSGSLAAAACKVGAILADSRKEVLTAYELAGRNIGICAQIMNDVRSFSEGSFGKSDVARHKKTLPLIFAVAHAEGEDRTTLLEENRNRIAEGDDGRRVAGVLDRVGAFDYSLIVANIYAQRAVNALETAGAKQEFVKVMKELLAV